MLFCGAIYSLLNFGAFWLSPKTTRLFVRRFVIRSKKTSDFDRRPHKTGHLVSCTGLMLMGVVMGFYMYFACL